MLDTFTDVDKEDWVESIKYLVDGNSFCHVILHFNLVFDGKSIKTIFGHAVHHACLVFKAGEPANFLAAPAPAPDFFVKQLRLLIFFLSGSGSCFFLQAATTGYNRLWLLTIGYVWQNILFPAN